MKTQKKADLAIVFIFLFLFGIVAFSGSHAFAQEWKSAYDEKSGNYWQWYQDSSGKKINRGWNYKTGSKWMTITESNGDRYGLSTFGAYWQYKKGSGFSFLFDNNIEDLKILLDKGLIAKEEYTKKKAELLK